MEITILPIAFTPGVKALTGEKHRAPLGMQRRLSAFIKVTIWCIPVVLSLPNVTLSYSFSHHKVILVATS